MTLTSTPTATSSLTPPSVITAALDVQAGWNLLALPVQPATPVSLEGLAQIAEASQFTPVAVVEWPQGQFQVHLGGQAADTFASDPVNPGAGYEAPMAISQQRRILVTLMQNRLSHSGVIQNRFRESRRRR